MNRHNTNSTLSRAKAKAAPTGKDSERLALAHALADLGASVFAACIDENGNPDVENDGRWSRWQKYPPGFRRSSYRAGDALGVVCGVVCDVLDVDPRNGGTESYAKLLEILGDDIDYFAAVSTPSGGAHYYIAPLGIGSHNNILPGIDLKGGNPDGSGRGFVFLPPTVRPGKPSGRRAPYEWDGALGSPGEPDTALAAILASYIDSRHERADRGRREKPSVLRQACVAAAEGQQRTELLRYVHELERKGYDKPDIIVLLRDLTREMPTFNTRRPWWPARGNPDKELLTLFHAPGRVIADATEDEQAVIDQIKPQRVSAKVAASGLQAFSEVPDALSEWLWARYLAFGDATVLDADPGTGKSLITLDVAARATTGRPMPNEDTGSGSPINVLLLAPEDRPEVTRKRLAAAGADISRVYRPDVKLRKTDRRGAKAYLGDEHLSFPHSIKTFRQWIADYNIGLVIVDPIVAFLDEQINSHNDGSVRRALEPFVTVLGDLHCSAVLIRHLNKDTSMSAANRGGGSVAFGAVSRIQLFAASLPQGYSGEARYGLSQVKNNHLEKRPSEALTYSIVNSDLVADNEGNMVPRIEWHGVANISAETLAKGERGTPGPEPTAQEEIIEVLLSIFERRGVWPASDVMDELKAAGVSTNKDTLSKVRKRLGIVAKPTYKPGGGIDEWTWQMRSRESIRTGPPRAGARNA